MSAPAPSPIDYSLVRPTRHGDSSIVPMINVVFLLLIFFLMNATLTPGASSGVAPPESATAIAAETTDTLVMGPDGTLAFGAARGEAAIAAIAEAVAAGRLDRLMIRADAGVEGAAIARLLTRLGEAGVRESALVAGD
ncbi:MAG: ExbD/TolR family protein [Paracoccaceae bacterium]